MKLKKLLAATAFVAATVTCETFAQTAPTVSTTDITAAGLSTGSGMQNAATSNWFSNNGETLLLVKGGATAVTATIKTQATSMSQQGYGTTTLSDQAVAIPSASLVVIGPFPTGRWNNQYGLCGVSLTSVTGISITSINVPQ